MDAAIRLGNYKLAEELSDDLSIEIKKDQKEKLTERKEYANYLEKQRETKKPKKSKLHWGMDSKERWETKGNM